MNTSEELIQVLEKYPFKQIKYTLGFKSKHPTTYMVDISAEKAIELSHKYCFDFEVYDNYIDFNCYTSNDMW